VRLKDEPYGGARLGKRLILNCDDFGQCRAANEAIQHLLTERKVSSATIMPPAPAFAEAVEWVRSRRVGNIGLHLTLTSEIEGHRWSSLTGGSSLHDESGYMPKTIREFEQQAKPEEVKAELAAQLEAVREAGIEVTHVDNHMGSLYGIATGRSYLPHVLHQCAKRRLPFRLPRYIADQDEMLGSIPNAASILAKVSALADLLGCRIPDYLLSHPYLLQEGETYDSLKDMLIKKLYALPDGVSEIYIHPAVDDAEMRLKMPSWEKRVWEYRLMFDDDFAYAMKDAGVILTDYSYVQQHLRKSRTKGLLKLAGLGRGTR